MWHRREITNEEEGDRVQQRRAPPWANLSNLVGSFLALASTGPGGACSHAREAQLRPERPGGLSVRIYLVGAYWAAAAFRLQGEVGDWSQWAQHLELGSRRSGPQSAVADLASVAASVLAGGSAEAPLEAGSGRQQVAGRWSLRACHCCCWRECWWQGWDRDQQVAGSNRS